MGLSTGSELFVIGSVLLTVVVLTISDKFSLLVTSLLYKVPNSDSLKEMIIRHTIIPMVNTSIVFLEHKTSETCKCSSQRNRLHMFNEVNY